MAMSCKREFVRFVCLCVVHNVSVYWHITSLNGSVAAGVEVSCTLTMRERFCSSCSMQLCSPIPLLADLLWPPLIVISCFLLLWVLLTLPECWQEATEAAIHLWAFKSKCSIRACLSHCHCWGLHLCLWCLLHWNWGLCLCLYVLFLHGKWS